MSELGAQDGWCEYRTSKYYHIVVDIHGMPLNPSIHVARTLCGRLVHEKLLLFDIKGVKITAGIPVTKRQLCPQCERRL